LTGAAQQLSARADAAAKQGNLRDAVAALRELVVLEPTAETWLKLGSLLRASGDLRGALDAVHQALELAPLDFMGLLSRAAILERLGAEDFGEAYGRALAHMPREPLPPALAQMVAHARGCHADYVSKRAAALDGAMADQLVAASPDVAARLTRFRSNALRQTRPYHSDPTHFHYPGLIEREFHDRADFPWLNDLEAATSEICAEMRAVMSSERAELVPYIQYASHEPLAQWAPLNHSRDWTAIHLLQNGRAVDANARHCPATMDLLSRLPQPVIAGCSPNAMFSLLAPRTNIPPHTGVSNTRLVCHLPLVVPEGCWFRVGAETRHWRAGEAFVFDDTIEHEAANPSDALRVVFIFDVWHPGLATLERDAVRAMLEADASGAALTL
jgi:aspartyl/asparaginyl beta-hydroxylase (cupin superfamily)